VAVRQAVQNVSDHPGSIVVSEVASVGLQSENGLVQFASLEQLGDDVDLVAVLKGLHEFQEVGMTPDGFQIGAFFLQHVHVSHLGPRDCLAGTGRRSFEEPPYSSFGYPVARSHLADRSKTSFSHDIHENKTTLDFFECPSRGIHRISVLVVAAVVIGITSDKESHGCDLVVVCTIVAVAVAVADGSF